MVSTHDTSRTAEYKTRPRVPFFLSLRHFVRKICGSPLFIVNKSANFQYGRLKALNKGGLKV